MLAMPVYKAVPAEHDNSSVAVGQQVGPYAAEDNGANALLWILPEDREYLNSASYIEFLKNKFVESEPAERLAGCKTFVPQNRIRVHLADHILRLRAPDGTTPLIREDEFKSSSYSDKFTGAWSEIWDMEMCGKTVRRGVVILKGTSGELLAMPMVPGTLADMRLQIDTLKITLGAFLVAGCKENRFAIIGAEPVDTSQFAFRIWKEAWTISRCGTSVTRIITFAPGAAPGGSMVTVEVPARKSPPK